MADYVMICGEEDGDCTEVRLLYMAEDATDIPKSYYLNTMYFPGFSRGWRVGVPSEYYMSVPR